MIMKVYIDTHTRTLTHKQTSGLPLSSSSESLFTVTISSSGVWRTAWLNCGCVLLLDVSLTRTEPEETIGIGYKMV